MTAVTTDKIALAAEFVNTTNSHIFLTGKAGTGKTTFLHSLARATHKSFVIVAPTGIAALNAGGVTIHSQFLLPLGTFLPGDNHSEMRPQNGPFYSRHDLARRHTLNSVRKQVLRDIELLIIDEVSMLRADLLDAIDFRLKSVKRKFRKSFGGVQLLMIGDLYQLPPVVKDQEWYILGRYYNSPHFFESLALQNDRPAYIELDKIFRQHDDEFIHILNNLRDNQTTQQDIQRLNEHYKGQPEARNNDVITITTHNYRANKMNHQALNDLPGPSHYYEADIEGDFPEHLHPLPDSLELRVGARVMFIKNDTTDNRFYNGKLARVTELGDDLITVIMDEEEEPLTVERMDWTNKKYGINQETREIEENVIGTFQHYPLKLAWAITVHKSQGLTFDNAIIDVGRAFAPGQVYVALSRLRSLEGLILRTPIQESVISSDTHVVHFSGSQKNQPPLDKTLHEEQVKFLRHLLVETFDFTPLMKQLDHIQGGASKKLMFEDDEMEKAMENLRMKLAQESQNTRKFRQQLLRLLDGGHYNKLSGRIEKGSAYYYDYLFDCLRDLLMHLEQVKQFSKTKSLQNKLNEMDHLLTRSIARIQKSTYITACILSGREVEKNTSLESERNAKRMDILYEVRDAVAQNPKYSQRKSGRKRKAKGETYKITYDLMGEGLSPEEVADKRNLTLGTIEKHITTGISSGHLVLKDFMDEDVIHSIEKVITGDFNKSLKEHHEMLKGKYSYGKIRMVKAQLLKNKE